MAKKGTKIKRYKSIYDRKGNSVIIALIMMAGLVVFGIAGWLLYTPVHDFIMGLGNEEQLGNSTVSAPSSSLQPISSQSSVSSQPQSEQETMQNEKEINGVYIPVVQVLDEKAFEVALQNAQNANVNTIVIDAKDAAGTVHYSSSIEVAKASGVAAASVYDAAKVADSIKQKGLSPAVRLHAFKDSAAPAVDRDMAVHYYDTDIYWLDNSPELGGKMWLNPYSGETREYILSIIEELCGAGFETILLDSVQFPSGVGLDKAGYGEDAKTVSKSKLLSDFVEKAAETADSNGSQLIICTDTDWLAPGAEINNQNLYGGSPNVFFTDKITVTLPEDSSVWASRIAMIKDSSESETVAVVRAYADDGTSLDGNSLIAELSSIGSNGYILYDSQGNYKLS